MISTLKGGFQDLMSLLITTTCPFHVSRLCRNRWTYALGFFSTAKRLIERPDALAALKARETNGPRPAPVTATILYLTEYYISSESNVEENKRAKQLTCYPLYPVHLKQA